MPSKCAPVVRTTWTGQPCMLPFVHRGAARDNCVWMGGVEACPVADGSWQACSPPRDSDSVRLERLTRSTKR